MITVELRGLRVFGHHGVRDHEKLDGQDFLFDVDLEVGDRGVSGRSSRMRGATTCSRRLRP
jgi:dihydroneopterin aldolase